MMGNDPKNIAKLKMHTSDIFDMKVELHRDTYSYFLVLLKELSECVKSQWKWLCMIGEL